MRAEFRRFANERAQVVPLHGGGVAVVYSDLLGDRIEHADGTVTPAEFTYKDDAAAGEPVYVIECSHDDAERPRIDAVHVLRWGGREIRSADLHRLRSLEGIVEDALLAISYRSGTDQVIAGRADDAMRRTMRNLRRQVRRKITPELLGQVADIYRANAASGAPVQAVANELGVAESTAFRYVKQARAGGHLEPREEP